MWDLMEGPSFRGIYTENIDGADYLVCPDDSSFSCDDGVTWEGL